MSNSTGRPLTLRELESMIAEGLVGVDDAVCDAWEAMRISPVRWQCSPWGDDRDGLWVIAEHDGMVVYYNEVEGGFNTSPFAERGVIAEYYCNQNSFHEFLGSLPEAREPDCWPASNGARQVPTSLAGGGEVLRRQTTYWEIGDRAGTVWRCHFKEKAEFQFREPAFTIMEIVRDHPILAHHHEAHVHLYVSSAPRDVPALLGRMKEQVALITEGWRQLGDYMNSRIDLRLGYGLLLEGPQSVVAAVEPVLDEAGVAYSVVGGRVPRGGLSALLMGRNGVVARAFRFEQLRTE